MTVPNYLYNDQSHEKSINYRSTTLIVGASGLCGNLATKKIIKDSSNEFFIIWINNTNFTCHNPNCSSLKLGSAANYHDWLIALEKIKPVKIILISNIRFASPMIDAIQYLSPSFRPRNILAVSTTAVYSKFEEYSNEYLRCEKKLRSFAGHCNILILRPSLIYGDKHDKNISQLVGFISRWKFAPKFYGINPTYQPIYFEDFANCIAIFYQTSPYIGTINVAGKEYLTYNEICQLIFKKLALKPRYIYIHTKFLNIILLILQKTFIKLPGISKERIDRLSEDKICDSKYYLSNIECNPVSFSQGLSKLIISLL